MNLKPEIASALFKELMGHFGLYGFNAETHYAVNELALYVHLTKKLDLFTFTALNQTEIMKAIFDPIKKEIMESDAVKQVIEEYTAKNAELEKEIALYRSENAYLKEFKIYYDLEFKLKHGESDKEE